MRVHLLAVPNTQPTAAFELDGFAQRTRYFAALCVALGHDVLLYGVEQTDVPGVRFISVMSEAQRQAHTGGPTTPYQYIQFDPATPLFQSFNKDVCNHLRVLKQPGDVIATIAGSANQLVAEANPELQFLEYSVGYTGVAMMAHRVYQSAAWQHVVYGYTGMQGGRVCDAVIPPWFPENEFPFTQHPEPFAIYCGRLIPNKGLAVACEAAKLAGIKLKVIGHGDPHLVTHGAEYLGTVPSAERNYLLSRAVACLMPTQYLEPFGQVAAEAQLCGTPVISTNFGAFVESVLQGVTGYRCDTLGEFVQALRLAPDLDRFKVRQRARAIYSEGAAQVAYRRYFQRLEALKGDGWRDLTPGLEPDDQSEPPHRAVQESYA